MRYLLDSNIIIYLLQRNKAVKKFLLNLESKNLAISVISRLEVAIGYQKNGFSLAEVETYLSVFENITFDVSFAKEAALLSTQNNGIKFKDLMIAATAKKIDATLITADKAFGKIPGLNVLYCKLPNSGN